MPRGSDFGASRQAIEEWEDTFGGAGRRRVKCRWFRLGFRQMLVLRDTINCISRQMHLAKMAPEVQAHLHDQCGGSSWNRFAATALYIANGIRTTNSVARNGDSDSVGASATNDGMRLKTCTITASTSK